MLTVYLLHTTGELLKTSLLFKSVLALWAVYFILLTLAVSTDFFFHIEADNRFVYGSWYPLLPLPQDLIMLLNLAGVIRRRKKAVQKALFCFFRFPDSADGYAADSYLLYESDLCSLRDHPLCLLHVRHHPPGSERAVSASAA